MPHLIDHFKEAVMVIKSAELDIVYGPASRIQPTGCPEIAFAGRSNVGKSSLINSLLNRKSLARTSSKPGKTRTINFYHVNNALYFVDLPGYGYTEAAVNARQSWGRMAERYLNSTDTLKAVLLLVDIRHRPNANDMQMYEWISSKGWTPVIIATKADKIKRSQLKAQLKLIRDTFGMDGTDTLIPFSAVTKTGREEILALIEERTE